MPNNSNVKSIQINGTDYTSFFPRTGYTVQYKKEGGQNSGLMLDGSFTEDTIAVKAIVTLPLMPLTEEMQSAIISDIMSSDYTSLYYFDPLKNAYRTAVMRYEITPVRFRGLGADENNYWTGMTVIFEDRFNMR